MGTDGEVRPLTRAELDWVVDLAAARRARIAAYAPTFWKPAQTARDLHATFLGRQIDDPDVVTLRTEHGFLFGAPRGNSHVVDDMAVDDDAAWPTDGTRLLTAAGQVGDLRFVCPVAERERTATAVALGMVVAETWWHRDLIPAEHVRPADGSVIRVGEAEGRLLPAPAVYDPGGPVLLITPLGTSDELRVLERGAAAAGATVSVVSQRPAQAELVTVLRAAGYVETTAFYQGSPRREDLVGRDRTERSQ